MDHNLRREINNLADAVREAYKIEVPIGDIDEIVERLDGVVEYNYYIPEFADGIIEKVNRENLDDPEFKITISELQVDLRKRFSIAHELGHLFLHMGYIIDEEEWNKTEETFLRKYAGEMEYQANEFAAAFLMPRKEFRLTLEENYTGNNSYNMGPVANYFNVSLDAAVNRGRWLGYLAWG